jgi:hypothetical protein
METANERRLRLAKNKRLGMRVERRFKRFRNEFEQLRSTTESQGVVNNSQERQNEHQARHDLNFKEIGEVNSQFYKVANDMKCDDESESLPQFSLDSISDLNSGVNLSKNNVNRLINKEAELFNVSLWKGFYDSILIFVQVFGFVFAMLLIVGLYWVIWQVFRVVVGF